MDIKHAIELVVSTFELAGVAVLIFGAVTAFLRFVYFLIRFRDTAGAYRHLRLYMGRSIVVGWKS
jgi:uncharacterized membrane protein